MAYMLETLSARQAAAILLQVPASGDAWLDELIDESARNKLQAYAMLALVVHNAVLAAAREASGMPEGAPWTSEDIAHYAAVQAEAMLGSRQLPLFPEDD